MSILEALRLTILSALRGLFDAVNWTRVHAGRVAAKAAFFGLSIWAITTVQLPLEAASWRLWMSDQALAGRIALWVVATSSLVLLVAGYAWAARRRALAVSCWIFSALIILLSLIGVWNRLLYEQQSARAQIAAALAVEGRVTDGQDRDIAAQIAYDAATAAQIKRYEAQIEAIPTTSPRARGRALDQLAQYQIQRAASRPAVATEREALTNEPARTSDPRPVDQVFGEGAAKTVAILFDLLRAITLKMFVIIAFPLALSPAPEVVAARRQEEERRKKRSDAGKRAAITRSKNTENLPALIEPEDDNLTDDDDANRV